MNISTISASGFMRYRDRVTVTLPKTGVVLVSGPNGSGKSSLVEVVAQAAWGESLRDESPWRDGEKGDAGVLVGAVSVERKRSKGGKVTLEWDKTKAYETTTKAQEALEHLVGPFEVWRRTSVLSSHDAAHFTMATDGERKRFLEAVFGLERFDEGATACRDERRQNGMLLATATNQLAVVDGGIASVVRRLSESQSLLDGLPEAGDDPAPLATEAARLEGLYAQARVDLDEARRSLRKADAGDGELRAALANVKSALAAMRGNVCPTCQQNVNVHHRKAFEEKAAGLSAELEGKTRAADATRKALEEQIAELNDEMGELASRVNELSKRAVAARGLASQRERLLEAIAGATTEHTNLLVDQKKVADTIKQLEHEKRVLDACDKVLGLKGVRAHVLSSALTGLESVANSWLARLPDDAGTAKIILRPSTETKKGTTQDALSLAIDGPGWGKTYRACSGGQRRRVDLAVLLALSDVVAAAYGRKPGTIFADEVFDALDATGTAAAVEVLEELAQERAVVVITHSDALVKHLTPAAHYRVEGGKIT